MFHFSRVLCMGGAALALTAAPSLADFVAPKIGGGTVMAPMLHADVNFDGTNLSLAFHVDHPDYAMLRPLAPGEEFNPVAIYYNALNGKAYNWQYAWNPDPGFNPALLTATGGSIWIERLSASPELEVFHKDAGWTPIFLTDGSRWKWNGGMVHNAYAVQNPLQDHYTAAYRLYIGDSTTGSPLAGYGSTDITWTWHADPVPEPASLSVLLLVGAGLVARRTCRF